MTALVPGIIVLGLYGAVWSVFKFVQSSKERHVDRVKILEDFEREVSRQQ